MRSILETELLFKPLMSHRLKLLTKKLQTMKFWELDIHLSDKEQDRIRHEDMKFAEEFIKDATFIATTWTWPWFWRNDIYEKDGKRYLIPDGAWVYEMVDHDFSNLQKVKCQSKSEITKN